MPKAKPSRNSEADQLREQLEELTQALKRERADAINLRRRHDEELAGLRTRMKANIVNDLLPIIDNFELSLKHVPENLAENEFVKGVQSIIRQFEKTLADMGVERIKTVGKPFDPHLHEALHMEEGGGTREIVSDELKAGYRLNDEVIRPATVRVKLEK